MTSNERTSGESEMHAAGVTRPRRLLLCLDGVPHELMNAARQRGLFEGFGSPSRLLSPFPTLTNIALSCMLDSSAPHGYESLYFDRNAREMRGGVRKYIGRRTPDKIPSSYMDRLDYQEPLAFEFLVYVAPEMVWRSDMRRFRDRFRAAPQTRDYFAFLKGTDGLLHIRGRDRLASALESLSRILADIQDFCGNETEIVVFSDHGMSLCESRRVHLQTHLKQCGYRVTNRLDEAQKRDVAVPAFGLCGYAALYCPTEESGGSLADALVSLEGVDFTVHRDALEPAVFVKSTAGVARIEQRADESGTSYRYERVTGDPLQLQPIERSLADAGEIDEKGFASDDVWYAHTADHVYPDALDNIFESMHGVRVSHTADVLVSLRDGYYYGASAFSRFVSRLAATHGNAMRASSNAFLMSTHREFPSHVRSNEARHYLQG